MTPPNKPHFHSTYEELLITKGCLSFDSNEWLAPYSYCYHPPGTVHGFKSVVKEETWFISRVGKELDFNFIDKPLKMNPYYIGGKKLDRPWVYHSDILNNVWQKTDNESSFVLSSDQITGACSFLLLVESGWSSDSLNKVLLRPEEVFILSGVLKSDDGHLFSKGSYSFYPPYSKRNKIFCTKKALIYYILGAETS